MKTKSTILSDNEKDPHILWAEIHILREELKGPEGFQSWRHAAFSERIQRVALQAEMEQKVRMAVHRTIEDCATATGQRMAIDWFVNRNAIVAGVLESDK